MDKFQWIINGCNSPCFGIKKENGLYCLHRIVGRTPSKLIAKNKAVKPLLKIAESRIKGTKDNKYLC